jgi:hypothetical protein
MQANAGAITSVKFNNHGTLNRLGLSGFVLNISEVSEQGHNVCHFELSFPQADADGILPCRADAPSLVNFARRVHEGFGIEVGGELQQDKDGRFYMAVRYLNFAGGRK